MLIFPEYLVDVNVYGSVQLVQGISTSMTPCHQLAFTTASTEPQNTVIEAICYQYMAIPVDGNARGQVQLVQGISSSMTPCYQLAFITANTEPQNTVIEAICYQYMDVFWHPFYTFFVDF